MLKTSQSGSRDLRDLEIATAPWRWPETCEIYINKTRLCLISDIFLLDCPQYAANHAFLSFVPRNGFKLALSGRFNHKRSFVRDRFTNFLSGEDIIANLGVPASDCCFGDPLT